jgi:hypothetical protein
MSKAKQPSAFIHYIHHVQCTQRYCIHRIIPVYICMHDNVYSVVYTLYVQLLLEVPRYVDCIGLNVQVTFTPQQWKEWYMYNYKLNSIFIGFLVH